MDIRRFRAELSIAFQADGFVESRLFKGGHKVWALPDDEITTFFAPDAQRRSWGFQLFGTIGIEIPSLRRWLNQHKPGTESGIFRGSFVGYYTANDDLLRTFQVEHGLKIPANLWVGLIKDRLNLIPRSVDDLLRVYRTNREELGWLAHPLEKPAWDFLLAWRNNPTPALQVPRMLPNGQIV